MNCFICIEHGQPVGNPIAEDNFRQAFPDIDLDNLPPTHAKFLRVACNVSWGVYEMPQSEYGLVDGVWQDVWSARSMTAEERQKKTQFVHDDWAKNGFPSWTFNEVLCAYVPPIPYPQDGIIRYWVEEEQNWVERNNA